MNVKDVRLGKKYKYKFNDYNKVFGLKENCFKIIFISANGDLKFRGLGKDIDIIDEVLAEDIEPLKPKPDCNITSWTNGECVESIKQMLELYSTNANKNIKLGCLRQAKGLISALLKRCKNND